MPDTETFKQAAYKIQIAIDSLDQRIKSQGEPPEEYRNQILALTEERRKLNQIIREMKSVAQAKGKAARNKTTE